MKQSFRTVLGLLLLLGAAAILFVPDLGSSSSARAPDLSITASRVEVRPDRRVSVAVAVMNRGAHATPFAIYAVSGWGERRQQLPSLGPGERRIWSWLSPPLPPGDYSLSLNVEAERDRIDLDGSNNFVRRILHVGSEREAKLRGSKARVPELVGLTRIQAARSLRRAGFGAAQWYEHAFGSTANRVESQWPAAGTRAYRATTPVLVVAADVTVPDVRGVSIAEARDRIEEARLVMGPLRHRNVSRDQHRSVLGQTPAPGSRVPFETGIGLVVGETRATWPVPVAASVGVVGLALVLPLRWPRRAPETRRVFEPRLVPAELDPGIDPEPRFERREITAALPLAAPPASPGWSSYAPPEPSMRHETVPTVASPPGDVVPAPMAAVEAPESQPELEPAPEPEPKAQPEPELVRFEDLLFVATRGSVRQEVAWRGNSAVPLIEIVSVRDHGSQTIRGWNEENLR